LPRSRSLTAPTASIGSGSTTDAISAPGWMAWPTWTGTAWTIPAVGERMLDLSASAWAEARAALAAATRLRGGQLFLRRLALVDQRLVGIVLGDPLVEKRLRLEDGGAPPSSGRGWREQPAATPVAPIDIERGDDAGSARHGDGAVIGLGGA
jgi:hypothetical protein